jgi:hypothetical protein
MKEPRLKFPKSEKRLAELEARQAEERAALDRKRAKYDLEMIEIKKNGPVDRTRQRREE